MRPAPASHRPLEQFQRRLAAWADSRVLPVGVVVLLALDFASGFNWLVSPAANLTSPAYSVAKQVAPMAVYGGMFMLGAVLAATIYALRGRSWWTGWTIGGPLAGLWLFWTVMLTLAPLGMAGSSFAGAIFAGCFTCLHLLFGLALAHVPPEDARPDRS